MRTELTPQVRLSSVLLRIEAGWSPLCESELPGPGDWGVLGLGSVTSGQFDPRSAKRLPWGISPRPELQVGAGDVLVARANGSRRFVGVGCVVPEIRQKLMLSDLIYRLVPNPVRLDSEFLGLVIGSARVRAQVDSSMRSTSGQFKISQADLRNFVIPDLLLPEQRRIVKVANLVEARISAEVMALRKEEKLWGGLVNRNLQEHIHKFKAAPLADVSVGRGVYGSNAAAVERQDRLPRYVRITDIDERGCLVADSSSVASVPWGNAQGHLLQRGDLLIARTGFTTGKSYLYRESDGLCAFAGYLVRFRIDPNIMMPEYAFMWTRADAFKSWVNRNVREVGQRNISAREYDGHSIPVPPITEQRKLVEVWESARSAGSLRQQEIARLRTLKQALVEDLMHVA
ncbi:hypothetical protein AB0894_20775 [Streptomyces sp. NPDC047916]|uniref:restriction endonuclease subunit S n=1 Tax=Streptomyces sp. NPDC047916 TaxID=3156681 RepID=UPI0034555D09